MADLDKKTQKAAPDLVQSVLEAQDKKNLERVDMLVTNAIKQLKMSRFKPDQTTCLSLTYLARINPKVFRQSSVIKDTLKSLLRRDNGPTNIKGKNDIVLPVLAANILLACCDTTEVRAMILGKIDQWLNGQSNGQKANELIQHLMATLCMKCQGDQQTIGTLVEMRQHWLQYLEDNFNLYGPIPVDLCANIRKLLHSESNCDCLIGHLNFLLKHDNDIDGLGDEMGVFILERPISLHSMLKQEESGSELNKMILKIFIKLFKHLNPSKLDSTKLSDQHGTPMDAEIETISSQTSQERDTASVIVKLESNQEKSSVNKQAAETKPETKPDIKQVIFGVKTKDVDPQPSKSETKKDQPHTEAEECINEKYVELPPAITYLYIRIPGSAQVIKLNKATLEALLSLISSIDDISELEFEELLQSWLVSEKSGRKQLSHIYEDYALTKPYQLHDRLRQKIIQSKSDLLVDLGLRDASANQLMGLLQLFGLPLSTIEKIGKRLGAIKDTELLRSSIGDLPYLNNLLDFYHELGSKSSKELQTRLTASVG